ncbi:MAG: RNA methyltransferase, partial [Gemmatimonadaceae bacterium]|nr:RNA methyltransferase [Chitinophagaceae bacterium]
SRFEWILEKVTEMGIREIYPLICERTEKQHFRSDRMKNILTSAMLQSQQHWLPLLHEPLSFSAFIADPQITEKYPRSFIAHCIQGKKESLRKASDNATAGKIILSGPEGDFSPAEISAAQNKNYIPVSLGDTRLRTETAAVTAAAFISIY